MSRHVSLDTQTFRTALHPSGGKPSSLSSPQVQVPSLMIPVPVLAALPSESSFHAGLSTSPPQSPSTVQTPLGSPHVATLSSPAPTAIHVTPPRNVESSQPIARKHKR